MFKKATIYTKTAYFLDALVSILGLDDVIIFNDLDPGLVLLVEKYFPYRPYMLFTIVSVAILYFSVKISEHIYKRRNY